VVAALDDVLLEDKHSGAVHFRLEEPDATPSPGNTLRALRVLRWYDAATEADSAGQGLDDRWRHQWPALLA